MEIDRQTEYEIRKYISVLVDNTIDKEIKKVLREDFKEFNKYELLCYSLISIENEFKLDTFREGSMHQNASNLRIILEWFIKVILKCYKIRKKGFTYTEDKYNKFQECITKILSIYGNYATNERFKQMRGINKINIEINDEGEYYFKNSIIEDDVDSRDNYFYGGYTSNEEFEKEKKAKGAATIKIFQKYFVGKSKISTVDFFSFNKIDHEIYSLCKENISVDIDKFGCGFNSAIFKDKETIVNILGAFMYMAHVIVIRNDFKSAIPGKIILFEKPVVTSKSKLINQLKKFFTISDDEINKIIDYFSLNNDSRLGINEYPLINIDDYILWIPSSIMFNDFQFSIVNGHYGKKIKINNHKETIAQSVVDKIVLACKKYDNIIISSDKPYADEHSKFNGEVLRGEIDVALYDTISNSLLIIECKWEDKLFVRGDQYKIICDEVNKIYKKQLEKDKYFLSLNISNLDFIFSNDERVKNRPYYPNNIQYIMIDKRIQLHSNGKHTLSEFNFLKIIKDNSINNTLRLDSIISYINSLETKVTYNTGNTISIIDYGGKKIRNSIFTLI